MIVGIFKTVAVYIVIIRISQFVLLKGMQLWIFTHSSGDVHFCCS